MAIGGVIASLITPYNAYGGIDTDGVGRLVDHAIKGGIQGILVNSSVGEAPHLSRGERIFVFEAAIEAACGRVPIYAGTGANSTEETLALTWDAGKVGVAAAFVAPPFYYPLPQAALVDHYHELARRGRLPLVVLNESPVIGNVFSTAALGELASVAGIAGLALVAIDQRILPAVLSLLGDDRPVLVAHDGLLLTALKARAAGLVSTLAGLVPGEVLALARAVRTRDAADAAARWARLQPLARLLDAPATGVAAAKAASTARGLPGGDPRSPLPGASEELRAAVEAALAAAGTAD